MTRIDVVLQSLRFSRGFTQGILDKVPEEDWYRFPEQGYTHVAWQVGHLAWAQHRLVFVRVAGDAADANRLLPSEYAELFGKGSTPKAGSSAYPSAIELRNVFDSVHSRVLVVVPTLAEALLDERTDPPHPAFQNKFEALLWAARHELVHAGQIAMIRRGLGHAPLR